MKYYVENAFPVYGFKNSATITVCPSLFIDTCIEESPQRYEESCEPGHSVDKSVEAAYF